MPGPDPRKARLMQGPKAGRPKAERPMTREEQKEANKNKKKIAKKTKTPMENAIKKNKKKII